MLQQEHGHNYMLDQRQLETVVRLFHLLYIQRLLVF